MSDIKKLQVEYRELREERLREEREERGDIMRDICMALLQVTSFPRDNWEYKNNYVGAVLGMDLNGIYLNVNGKRYTVTIQEDK